MEPLTLSFYLEEFCEYMARIRNASPHTLRCYRRDVENFISFVETRQEEVAVPTDLNAPLIRAFLAQGFGQVKGRSIVRWLSTLRSFGGYLKNIQCVIEENIAEDIRAPKMDKTLPRVLSVDEVFRLLAAESSTTPVGARNRAILEVLYAASIRVAELCGLDIDDIDFKKAEIRVRHGKGGNERIVLFGGPCREALENYLLLRRSFFHPYTGHRDSDALFLRIRGTRLTARSVHRIVAAAGKKTNLPWSVSPHVFRHSSATHMMNGGADLRVIQELLGHVSVSTTEGYTHVAMERLFQVHESCHPLSQRYTLENEGSLAATSSGDRHDVFSGGGRE